MNPRYHFKINLLKKLVNFYGLKSKLMESSLEDTASQINLCVIENWMAGVKPGKYCRFCLLSNHFSPWSVCVYSELSLLTLYFLYNKHLNSSNFCMSALLDKNFGITFVPNEVKLSIQFSEKKAQTGSNYSGYWRLIWNVISRTIVIKQLNYVD